jgi:hypothetical protein
MPRISRRPLAFARRRRWHVGCFDRQGIEASPMNTLTRWGLPLVASSIAIGAPAFAEEAPAESQDDVARADDPMRATDAAEEGRRQPVLLAPRRAFEIGVNAGYAQPFGNIDPSRPIEDYASAGGAVGLDLAYRATPYWSVGA